MNNLAGLDVFETTGQSAGGKFVSLDIAEVSGMLFMMPLSWLIDSNDQLINEHIEQALDLAACYKRRAIISLMATYPNYAAITDMPPSAIPAHWLKNNNGDVPSVRYNIPARSDFPQAVNDTDVPVIWDEHFLSRYEMALRTIGQFYDGGPRIARIQVGIGTWGETFLDFRFFVGTDTEKSAARDQWLNAGWTQPNWLYAVDRILAAAEAAFTSTSKGISITDFGWPLVSGTCYDPTALQTITESTVASALTHHIDVLQFAGLGPGPQWLTDEVMYAVIAAHANQFAIALEAFGPSANANPGGMVPPSNPCADPNDANCSESTYLNNMVAWAQGYSVKHLTFWPADIQATVKAAGSGPVTAALLGKQVQYAGCKPPTKLVASSCQSQVNNCWPMRMHTPGGQKCEAYDYHKQGIKLSPDGATTSATGITEWAGACSIILPERPAGSSVPCTCETIWGISDCISWDKCGGTAAVTGCIHNEIQPGGPCPPSLQSDCPQ